MLRCFLTLYYKPDARSKEFKVVSKAPRKRGWWTNCNRPEEPEGRYLSRLKFRSPANLQRTYHMEGHGTTLGKETLTNIVTDIEVCSLKKFMSKKSIVFNS